MYQKVMFCIYASYRNTIIQHWQDTQDKQTSLISLVEGITGKRCAVMLTSTYGTAIVVNDPKVYGIQCLKFFDPCPIPIYKHKTSL
jgi:hypothetical protein